MTKTEYIESIAKLEKYRPDKTGYLTLSESLLNGLIDSAKKIVYENRGCDNCSRSGQNCDTCNDNYSNWKPEK